MEEKPHGNLDRSRDPHHLNVSMYSGQLSFPGMKSHSVESGEEDIILD